MNLFNKLYRHYTNTFDLELRLKATNTTYAEAHRKAMQDEEWW